MGDSLYRPMQKLINLKNLSSEIVLNALTTVYEDWDFRELATQENVQRGVVCYQIKSKNAEESGCIEFEIYKENEQNFLNLKVLEKTDWTEKAFERLLEYIA